MLLSKSINMFINTVIISGTIFLCSCNQKPVSNVFNKSALESPSSDIQLQKGEYKPQKIYDLNNSKLDFKMSLYPSINPNQGKCYIIFWSNKGGVDNLGIKTESGKVLIVSVENQDVVTDQSIKKYRVTASFTPEQYLEYFVNDLPSEISFKIQGFGNGQYATITIPNDVVENFKAVRTLFNGFAKETVAEQKQRKTEGVKDKAAPICFMGIPIQGKTAVFNKKLKEKGFKFKHKKEITLKSGKICKQYTYEGKFWRFSSGRVTTESLGNQKNIGKVSFLYETPFSDDGYQADLVEMLLKKYGSPIKVDDNKARIKEIVWKLNGGYIICTFAIIMEALTKIERYYTSLIYYNNDFTAQIQEEKKIEQEEKDKIEKKESADL